MPDLFARVVPIVKSALPAGRRDPRVAGLRRGARIVVTGWVLCVIPLLLFTLGYLLLHLPGIDRALWRSARMQADLMSAAVTGHHYAVAAADTSTIATCVRGSGIDSPSSRMPSKCNSIASRMLRVVSSTVLPVLMHPGRSGT